MNLCSAEAYTKSFYCAISVAINTEQTKEFLNRVYKMSTESAGAGFAREFVHAYTVLSFLII